MWIRIRIRRLPQSGSLLVPFLTLIKRLEILHLLRTKPVVCVLLLESTLSGRNRTTGSVISKTL